MSDVEVFCAKCGKMFGIAIDDQFHPKGWLTAALAKDAVDCAPPISLAQLGTLDNVAFPCSGAKHPPAMGPRIHGAILLARSNGKRKVDVVPARRAERDGDD